MKDLITIDMDNVTLDEVLGQIEQLIKAYGGDAYIFSAGDLGEFEIEREDSDSY